MTFFKKHTLLLCATILLPMTMLGSDIKGVLKYFGDKPVAGYTIKNINNEQVAMSDDDGAFTIEAKNGDVIQVLYSNVVVATHSVTSNSPEITLTNTNYLASVDAVGLGNIDRERTSSAIDVVTADKIGQSSHMNTTHALIGQFSSLLTTQSSGNPVSDDISMSIRGGGTPLVLVDGFESSLDLLSAHEIESVCVLKDAVATALYGMRGANGVVLIKTKMGAKNSIKIEVGGDYGIVQAVETPEFVDAKTYASLVNVAHANDGLSPRYTDAQVAAQGSDPYLYPDIDWADMMLKSASTVANANVSISGGSEKVQYYTLFDYSYYEGSFNYANDINDGDYDVQNSSTNINIRTNVSMQLTNSTQLDIRMGARIKEFTNTYNGAGTYYSTLISTPNNRYVLYNEDGSYGGSSQYTENPMAELVELGYYDYHYRYFDVNVALHQDFNDWVKGLTATAAVGFSSRLNHTEYYGGSSYSVSELVGSVGGVNEYVTYGQDVELGYSSRSSSQERSETYRASIDYDRTFNDHSLMASFVADGSKLVYQNYTESYNYANFALRANYGYKDKYFVDLVASTQGSNDYNPENQFGFFPAAGASWIASKEDFLKGSKAINYLKFRSSFGVTGNDDIGSFRRFAYVNDYATSGYGSHRYGNTAGTVSYAAIKLALANEDFTWAKEYKFNIGFDARLFDNVNLTFDAFLNKRVDGVQSMSSTISAISGILYGYDNYYSIKRWGFDASLNYTKEFASGITFTADLAMGMTKNEYLKYYEMANTVTSYLGQSSDAIWGYESIGFYESDSDIANSPTSLLDEVQPGDIKYKDQNSDGVIDQYDRVVIGNSVPTLHTSLNLGVKYKGVYLTALFDSQTGYDTNVLGNIVYDPLSGTYDNISVYASENYWTAERGDMATLPRLTTFTNDNNQTNSTLWLMNGNFLRLRTAEIGYEFPKRLLDKIHTKGLKVFARGHNLFVIDGIEGLDAEVISGYPMSRYYNLGLNIQF